MRQARIHHHDHQPRWQLTKPFSALRAPIRQAFPPLGEASSRAKGARRHCASGVPLLIIATVAVLCLSGGTGMSWLPLLAVGPALAAATSGPWGVLRIGVLAVALGAALGVQGARRVTSRRSCSPRCPPSRWPTAWPAPCAGVANKCWPPCVRLPRPHSTPFSSRCPRRSGISRRRSTTAPPLPRHASAGTSTPWCPHRSGCG